MVNLVGNLFGLEKKISKKSVVIIFISTITIALLKYFYQEEILLKNLDFLSISAYSIMGLSTAYLFFKYKLVWKFFKKYMGIEKISLIAFFSLWFELLIFISFIVIHTFPSTVFGILFLFSGLQRVIIQNTRALFFSDISKLRDFIMIYGYSRASYFAAGVLFILKYLKLDINLNLPTIFFAAVLLFYNAWFILNLYPYFKRQNSVRDCIVLLRQISNKSIKIKDADESIDNKKKIVDSLKESGFIRPFGDRIELTKTYKWVYSE